jgi:polar amino acid transport system substrate-binding protein
MHRSLNMRALLLAPLCCVLACSLPRDADGTLERVHRGVVRVGVVVDTPWVTDSVGAGGIEGRMIRELARELGARIEWVSGKQSDLLETLHHREIDAVVGGLTAASPWAREVALTLPFYTDTVAVSPPAGSGALSTLEGITVGVEAGDPIAGVIRAKGGEPVLHVALDTVHSAIAAPTWKLDGLHRSADRNMILAQNPHVIAVSPGENAWMMRVEKVLLRHRDSVGRMLRAARPR